MSPIAHARQLVGWGQTDLAWRLRTSNVSVWMWETGKRRLSPARYERLVELLERAGARLVGTEATAFRRALEAIPAPKVRAFKTDAKWQRQLQAARQRLRDPAVRAKMSVAAKAGQRPR